MLNRNQPTNLELAHSQALTEPYRLATSTVLILDHSIPKGHWAKSSVNVYPEAIDRILIERGADPSMVGRTAIIVCGSNPQIEPKMEFEPGATVCLARGNSLTDDDQVHYPVLLLHAHPTITPTEMDEALKYGLGLVTQTFKDKPPLHNRKNLFKRMRLGFGASSLALFGSLA